MDVKKMISGLSKSGALNGVIGGIAGGGLSSLVSSKKGRKTGKTVLQVGALAAVGGLAWKAYQQYSSKNQANEITQPSNVAYQPQAQFSSHSQSSHTVQQDSKFDFTPARMQQHQFEEVTEDTNPNGQLLLMRAMISAAYSDGHIDEHERQRIYTQVENMDLSLGEKSSLFDELKKPLSLDNLVSQVPDAQTGIEIYTASASAIDLDEQDSQAYLQALANQLCIPTELTASIQQQIQQY